MVKLGRMRADRSRDHGSRRLRSADYSWIEITRVLPPVQ
jgi:hypothetical protein